MIESKLIKLPGQGFKEIKQHGAGLYTLLDCRIFNYSILPFISPALHASLFSLSKQFYGIMQTYWRRKVKVEFENQSPHFHMQHFDFHLKINHQSPFLLNYLTIYHHIKICIDTNPPLTHHNYLYRPYVEYLQPALFQSQLEEDMKIPLNIPLEKSMQTNLLTMALHVGNEAMVKYLIEKQSTLMKNMHHKILYGARSGNKSLVMWLLNLHLDGIFDWAWILKSAIESGNLSLVEWLMSTVAPKL
jgi:hypothetical protein